MCTQSETVQSRPWVGTVVVLYVTLQDRVEGQSAQTVDTQAGGKGLSALGERKKNHRSHQAFGLN